MKLLRTVFWLTFLSFLFIANNSSFSLASTKGKNYVEGELLVKYEKGTISADSFIANSISGAKVVEEFPDSGWQRIKLPADTSVESALTQFTNFQGVENVQPNYIYNLAATPNDQYFGSLYGMQKISAPTAWDVTTGNRNVIVAVIDTGVRYTHEDLAANIWHNSQEIAGNGIDDDGNGFVDDVKGWDFFYNDADPMDENGHGTHVAGTIGAAGNNSVGVVGVNWNVRLLPIKIYNSSGYGTTSAMLVNAYNYIRALKLRGENIRVTSNSYGGCDEACGYDQATKDAIDRLGDAGILNVFAAGNAATNIDQSPFYPASYTSPSILTVAASDQNDSKASFSNYGAQTVDLAAPGVNIFSSIANSDSAYTSLSGTSMATPHVSGAAALLAASNPNLSAASLKATLMNTVDQLQQWNNVVKTGGRLNVAKAIQQPTVCNFDLSQTSLQFIFAGGSGSITVTAASNCDYSIESLDNWITVTNGNTGSGTKTINFTVAQSPNAQRTGTIRIAGNKLLNIAQLDDYVRVSGKVSYGIAAPNESPKNVSNALISINGQQSSLTDSTGAYSLNQLQPYTQYNVTAAKTGDVNGISAFDATLVLRCVAAQASCALTANQKIAADANGDNQLTAFDATQILRFAAANQQTAGTGNVGTWKLSPANRQYSFTSFSYLNENYEAILIGEVSGDWTAQ